MILNNDIYNEYNIYIKYFNNILFNYELQGLLSCTNCHPNTINTCNIWSNYYHLTNKKIIENNNLGMTDIVIKCLSDLVGHIQDKHIKNIINISCEKNWVYYELDNLINPIILYDPYTEKLVKLSSLVDFDNKLALKKSASPPPPQEKRDVEMTDDPKP